MTEFAKDPTDVYGREVSIDQEKKIWEKFIGQYQEYDKGQLIEIVRQSINLITSFMLNNKKLGLENFKKFRKGYMEYLRNNGINEDGIFESKYSNSFERLMQRNILKDTQIKSSLEKVFDWDGDATQKFVADVIILMRSPKMKTFVFKYLKHKQK